MLEWAREAVAQGYVALLVDSFGPRGVKSVCMGPQGGVSLPRGVRDALQAVAHLRTFDFVDGARIAVAGYSWGAMVATIASSNRWGSGLAAGERPAAAAAFYPGCFTITPLSGRPWEVMNADVDRPLLVLMGDQDTETPPSDCLPKLEAAKAAGAPVEWHLYRDVTHCWDCKNLDGFTKFDARGHRVAYRYDADVTRDSARRLFEFLGRTLAARP
jgi:dienelactone hydrolase